MSSMSTSEMQSCMLWTKVCIWSGRQESCSWVSEWNVVEWVYWELLCTKWLEGVRGQSLAESQNWARLAVKDGCWRLQSAWSSLWERMVWSVVSNAADRPRRFTTVKSPLSKACRISFIIFRFSTVPWPAWRGGRRLLALRYIWKSRGGYFSLTLDKKDRLETAGPVVFQIVRVKRRHIFWGMVLQWLLWK